MDLDILDDADVAPLTTTTTPRAGATTVLAPEDADDFAPPVAYSNPRVILPQGTNRAQAVHFLNQNTPSNEYGLPQYFVRSDLLPHDLETLTQQDVDGACVGLFYFDGFPTLEGGSSFWSQLPHEPYPMYELFQKYLDQAADLGIRQLDMLSHSTGAELSTLQDGYKEFYWSARSRAYDIFIVAAEQKRREHRIRSTENKHFGQAEGLLASLMKKFDDEDWIEELNAKEAIEALETLIKVQRLSLGLTGQHSSSTPRDKLPEGASPEAIVRQITRGAGLQQDTSNTFQSRLEALLSNEEDGMQVQEAILRIGRAGDGGATGDKLFNDVTGIGHSNMGASK